MIRVVSLPIREVLNPEGRVIDTFRPMWDLSTQLANWAVRELALRDVRRTPDMEKFPRYDRKKMFGEFPRRFARKAKGDKPACTVGDPQTGSLYDLWNRECPFREEFDGVSASARDILTNVERVWTNHKDFGRFAVMWKGSASGANYKWPFPWPVPADKGKTLKLSREGKRPVAEFPGFSDERIAVRLSDGSNFKRQLKRFDFLREHPDRMKQAKITGRFESGKLVGADLRLVGDFDAVEHDGDADAVLTLGSDHLLSVVVDGDDGNPFVYNADQLKGVIHAYDRWRHRFNRDMKHEKRWPADKRRRTVFGPTAQARMERNKNRLKCEAKQIGAMVGGFAKRRGVAVLHYDDSLETESRFLPHFDYTMLREVVKCNCEDRGIEFKLIGGDDDAE